MKKKLALFMTMMLVMSMIPFSSFADEGDNELVVLGGVQDVSNKDSNESISLVINLGDYMTLSEGNINIDIKNAKLSMGKNSISYRIVQNDKELENPPKIEFVNKFDEELYGGEDRVIMKVLERELINKGKDNIKIYLDMNFDFSNSELGDIELDIKDVSQTGVGNHKEKIAKNIGYVEKNAKITVVDQTTRIGLNGGVLSAFSIENMDKLDSVSRNNQVTIKLPMDFKFDTKTAVKIDGKPYAPLFNEKQNELIIEAINSSNKIITVTPYIIPTKEAEYGNISATIEYKVNKRTVSNDTFIIGKLTNNFIDIEVREKGVKKTPTIESGESRVLEFTLNGIKESFKKNEKIMLDFEGVELVYGKFKILEPKGKVMPLGESQGKNKLINGKEIYKNGEIELKVLDSNINKITFEAEVTAPNNAKGVAKLKITSNYMDDVTGDIANIISKFLVSTEKAVGQKGVKFKTNDITITESNSGMLNVGDKIYLILDKNNIGFDTDLVKVTASSGVEISNPRNRNDGIIELEVLRKSYSAPSKIVISGIQVYSLETAVSATSKIEIKINENSIFETEYVQIVSSDKVKSTTIFTIDSKEYIASGEKKQSIQAPYIKNGYTMLPVRALAESLGLVANWDDSQKIATFTGNGKIARVELGSSTITVNGTPIKLSVPSEVKGGVTMIELRSLANIFNVQIDWNGNLKTATVIK